MPSEAEPFDPSSALQALAEAGVDFIVIGGVAGGAHGSSYGTFDLDIVYARDRKNLERLAVVLEATLRGAPSDLPFQLDAYSLEAGDHFTFSTRLGSMDILGRPAGAPPYETLKAAATTIDVAGHAIRIASLDPLIAMKEAAGRPRDKLMATEYRVLAEDQRADQS